jgi:hypothetical protein
MPERSTAALTANAASDAPGTTLNSPRCDLVSGVLAVETMTASRMAGAFLILEGCVASDRGVSLESFSVPRC